MPHSYSPGQQRVEVYIDYEHQMHHEGKAFHFSNVKSGIGAASYDYLIENDGERAHLRSVRVSVENGTADINIYEAPTVSNNGVQYTNVINLNRQSTKTPTANVYYDTTYSNKELY